MISRFSFKLRMWLAGLGIAGASMFALPLRGCDNAETAQVLGEPQLFVHDGSDATPITIP